MVKLTFMISLSRRSLRLPPSCAVNQFFVGIRMRVTPPLVLNGPQLQTLNRCMHNDLFVYESMKVGFVFNGN